jgi:hypothetical protein
VIHEAGSMAVAKHHGRGPHLILIGEFGETAKLLDDSNVWKAIEALAQFIEDNYEGDGCYGAKELVSRTRAKIPPRSSCSRA